MSEANKKISVIVACFNCSEWVRQSFESLKNQTMPMDDLEVIFVDDASNDDGATWGVLEELEKEAPESVRLIHLEKNVRQGGARNAGMKIMTGEYMLLLDSDDLYRPETCQELYDLAKANDTDIIQFQHDIVWRSMDDVSIPPRDRQSEDSVFIDLELNPQIREMILTDNPWGFGCTNKFYRIAFLRKVGATFAEGKVYEEPKFVFPLFLHASRYMVIDAKYYIYRKRQGSTMNAELGIKLLDHPATQLELMEYLFSDKEIYNRYKEEIDYQFVFSYLFETLRFYVVNGGELPLSFFEEMVSNVKKYVPEPLNNRFIQAREYVKMAAEGIGRKFESQKDLYEFAKRVDQCYRNMENPRHFDVLIVVTPADCERVRHLYPRLIDNFEYGNLMFIGAPEVGDIVRSDDAIKDHVDWTDENALIPFNDVHACMAKRLEPLIGTDHLPRGITGWYYQQFLKMQYAFECKDEYYMVWDGDTVPCRKIEMFSKETDQPYLDLKHEFHPEYFDTMGKILPGFRKVIERSFISEHMLFRADIMRSLIADIEKNDQIPGEKFWEKIINAIEPEKIYDSSFSEFETYGTYVALRQPNVYKLREWHSFRLGASFFDMHTICDRDFEWLGKDFDAISFEKGQSIMKGNENFFDNPEYQQKLSAKKMLQLAQMEYKDGYKEVWEDDLQNQDGANVKVGGFNQGSGDDNRTLIVIVSYNAKELLEANIKSIRDVLTEGTYQIVVVDNTSTDGACEWLKEQQDIILVANQENRGFGPACNQGVLAGNGTEFENADILFLNDDAMLVFDSLYFLRKALYSAEDIGAAGSLSNFAGNKQQIDVTFDTVEEYVKFGEKNNVPMSSPFLEKVRLSGFSMLVKRKVWNEIGGFDEDFAPGYYEDDALSVEILKQGYRLLAVRNSFVYHVGRHGFGKEDYTKLIDNHQKLFAEKYGFNIDDFAHGSAEVISKISFAEKERFRVLEYGCGLGANLKTIKSLFPNSEAVGIEPRGKLFEIAKKTEDVLNSLDEFMSFYEDELFDVMIINKSGDLEIDQMTEDILTGFVAPNGITIVKEAEDEDKRNSIKYNR